MGRVGRDFEDGEVDGVRVGVFVVVVGGGREGRR
jgi:hypothetical protein